MAEAMPAAFVSAKLALKMEQIAATLYCPAMVLAVKAGAVATPDPSVVTTQAVLLHVPPKTPLAPLTGAVNVTPTFGIAKPAASTTFAVKSELKPVFTFALCGVPLNAEIPAGVCASETVSGEMAAFVELECTGSPPPYAPAALVTLPGEVAGMFTINLMTGKLEERAMAELLVHVAVPVAAPLQLHEESVVEKPDTRYPAGRLSTTVVVPLVAAKGPVLLTVMSHSPVPPWVKPPMCCLTTDRVASVMVTRPLAFGLVPLTWFVPEL